MKRKMAIAGLAVLLLAAVAAAGVRLYRHFVADRVMDGGDMENPFLAEEEVWPLLPEDCTLVFLSWSQNAMSYDDSYRFSLGGGPETPYMACFFTADGRRLELGTEETETGEEAPGAALSREKWEQVERLLREMSLPRYQSPEPGLSDAVTNCLSLVRMRDGQRETVDFDGTDAIPLGELLRETAQEAAAAEAGEEREDVLSQNDRE